MKWIRKLFQLPPQPPIPTHDEIMSKTERIKSDDDKSGVAVKIIKEQHTRDLQELSKQAKIVTREAKKLDTAIAIYMARDGKPHAKVKRK